MLLYIFSKNRACQLENLLAGLSDLFYQPHDIEVLYTCDEEYEEGYEILKREYPIKWTRQTNATKQFLSSICLHDIVGIFTDDCHFFRIADGPITVENVGSFSLRLGFNTIVQDHWENTYQPYLNHYIDEGDTIRWPTYNFKPTDNYGYTFGLDGVFYSSWILQKLIDFEFNNPPELETKLFSKRHLVNPWIRSFKQSCVVNVPLTSSNSGFTRSMNVDQGWLNKEFVSGKRLRYDRQSIVGAHQNLAWELWAA